jgi:hypothetical protein
MGAAVVTAPASLSLQGALRHRVRRSLDHHHRQAMRLARRGLRLPRSGPVPGVWAVAMVKNEQDIIVEAITHLLEQGVARVLVVDNGSSDDTVSRIRSLDTDRVLLGEDREFGYYQAAKMTLLGRFASRHSASWVVPFDADEFWFAPRGSLADFLEASPSMVHRAGIRNAFLTTTAGELRIELEEDPLRKVAYRPHSLALLTTGNHWVSRPGPVADALALVHVPWRSRAQVAAKLRGGAQAIQALVPGQPGVGGHWLDHRDVSDAEVERMWGDLLSGTPVPQLSWTPTGGPTVLRQRSDRPSWRSAMWPHEPA